MLQLQLLVHPLHDLTLLTETLANLRDLIEVYLLLLVLLLRD